MRLLRTILAFVGFAPMLEGFNSWTGKDDPEMMLTAAAMYAVTKGIEIAFESIPESIIQVKGLLGAGVGEVETIQVVSVLSSILAAGFIIMEANFGFIQSHHVSCPGDEYFAWIPTDSKKR